MPKKKRNISEPPNWNFTNPPVFFFLLVVRISTQNDLDKKMIFNKEPSN